MPTVLQTRHELYCTITCEKFHPGKTGSLFCTAGIPLARTKFSYVIPSACLSGMKNDLTHACKGKLKENLNKFKQIPGGKLSHRAEIKFDFPM